MSFKAPDEWRRCHWGDLATLHYGKALRDPAPGPVVVYGTNGPTGKTTDEQLGDGPTIVVGRKGAYRGITWAPGAFWVIDTAFFLEPKAGVDLAWAYYALLAADINGLESGSAIPSTRREDFYAMSAVVPSLTEQRRIAATLQALDAKLAHNTRLAQRLAEVPKALFSKRFGSAEGEASLGDLVHVVRGRSYKSSELNGDRAALVTLKCFSRGGGYSIRGLKPYSGTYRPEQEVLPGDLVIAQTDLTQAADVIGRPALIPDRAGYEVLVASLDTAIIRPRNDQVSVYWLKELMRTPRFIAQARAHANGSTVLHLGKGAVRDFRVRSPGKNALEDFDAIARPIFERITAAEAEVQRLSAIRSELLPRLVSGVLRVADDDMVAHKKPVAV